jgi:hypothetical protein
LAEPDAQRLHRLFGPAKRRITFKDTDFLDYQLMLLACAAVIWLVYRPAPWLVLPGLLLCVFMALSFPLRHGFRLRLPVLFSAPLGLVYMVAYKLHNLRPMYLLALVLFAADNLFIWLTPELPHHTELLREIAIGLFYSHLVLICVYRTVILVAHLRQRETVREVLLQTTWRAALARQPNVSLHIVHAYATGLLSHLMLLAPWYLVVQYASFSLLTLLPLSVMNVLMHMRYLQSYNDWFYRDHWLAHNAEIDFIYLHGAHHDAIPCALIGVSGNGFMEGVFRCTLGNPIAVYSPLVTFLMVTAEVAQDMRMHQYIPGVYPRLGRDVHAVAQHSTHHFGRLEPYSVALRMQRAPEAGSRKGWLRFPPVELLNSIELDEKLNGFQWDNARYQQFLALYDRYEQ